MVADFNKKQKGKTHSDKLAFQIAGILFLVVVVALIFADIKIYQKKKELALQIENYKKQIASIQKNSQTLKDEIANSNSADYLEKIAYEQLGEQKPGETEYIFTSPDKKTQAPSNLPSQNFWTSWISQFWNWLKSKF